jgi:hypothetical protein
VHEVRGSGGIEERAFVAESAPPGDGNWGEQDGLSQEGSFGGAGAREGASGAKAQIVDGWFLSRLKP